MDIIILEENRIMNNKLNGVLIATAAAAIFATLPVTAMADSSPAPATAKASNNCCGTSHKKSTSSSIKKGSVTKSGNNQTNKTT